MKVAVLIVTAIICAAVVACAADDETRLTELGNICAYISSDWLEANEVVPSPDEIMTKYNIATNVLVQDLKTVAARHSLETKDFYEQIPRRRAIIWIGKYGGTNDLQYLFAIMTNKNDYAQKSAIGAGMTILKHSPELINFARGIITNDVSYSARTREWVYCCLYGRCAKGESDSYIDDPAQHIRIAAFFKERAAAERSCPLYVDSCVCKLDPTYRHSQQRRDNLAAVRSPDLTGEPAEAFDAAQRDAAEGGRNAEGEKGEKKPKDGRKEADERKEPVK